MTLIPLAIVDDDEMWVQAQVETLSHLYPDRRIFAFTTLRDAKELIMFDEPFLLILDHDLGREGFGHSLAREIRTMNPFGLTTPICYYSAQLDAEKYQSIGQQDGQLGPTYWVDKSEFSIKDVVDAMDRIFATVRQLWLTQAERLLLNLAAFEAYDSLGTSE